MKRITKNIIHFSIVILMLILIVTPMLLNMPSGMQQNQPPQQQMQSSGNGAPPEMPGGSSSQNGEPPAKPDGDNMSMQDGQTLPAKPDGDESSAKSGNNTGFSQNSQTPPEKPNGEEPPGMQNTQGGSGGDKGSSPMGAMDMQQNPQQKAGIDILGICVCSIEFLILTIFLVYLIMSRANKYNFRDTFSTKKRKIIYVISVVVITVAGVIILNIPFGGSNAAPNQMADQKMNSQSQIEYNAEKTINSNTDEDNKEYSSSIENKLAVLVTGKISCNLNNFKLNKTGSANEGGDNTSFYGTNSGILAKESAALNINGAEINTDAKGANGVFSFGGSMQNNSSDNDGTIVTVKNTAINTKQDDSGGVMTTGGGIMHVIDCIIETLGTSSAAIRTDRGGGTVDVEGGTYKTSGQGSPSIYSTADVSVNNACLESNTSEGVVIEGKNKVALTNCKLTDNNTKLNGQSTTYKNVFLYQSMSGDSASGTSEFNAKETEIITNKGDSFYVTNTNAKINLENNSITNNDISGNFLRIQKDSWGRDGSNGGDVVLNMAKQSALGNIVVDSISKLEMNMTDNSYWEGSINGENIALKLDDSSKIKLTGDCSIESLETSTGNLSNIDFNGHKFYVNGSEISG